MEQGVRLRERPRPGVGAREREVEADVEAVLRKPDRRLERVGERPRSPAVEHVLDGAERARDADGIPVRADLTT
jgi:hypothetical protein